MTRRLAGIGQMEEGSSDGWDYLNNVPVAAEFRCDNEHYTRAINALKNCKAVIVTERFVESIVLLEKSLDLAPLIFCQGTNFNRSSGLPISSETLSPEFRQHILTNNKFDVSLYNKIEKDLDEKISSEPASFAEAVMIRNILREITKPSPSTSSTNELGQATIRGVTSLLQVGMKADALKVLFLVMLDPVLGASFKTNWRKYFGRYFQLKDLKRTEEYYREESYYATRL